MADKYASLASATATAIDSAAKHNLQCRMYTELLQHWVDPKGQGNSAETLKAGKMDYCMHKDEIVLGARQGFFPDSHRMPPKAYPLVFTTYANMPEEVRTFLKVAYAMPSMSLLDAMVKSMNKKEDFDNWVQSSPGASLDANTKKFLDTVLAMLKEQITPDSLSDIKRMPQFYFQGISLGVAYAHPDSGDTVGTVMYGGLR